MSASIWVAIAVAPATVVVVLVVVVVLDDADEGASLPCGAPALAAEALTVGFTFVSF
jgi:hypothetical protein